MFHILRPRGEVRERVHTASRTARRAYPLHVETLETRALLSGGSRPDSMTALIAKAPIPLAERFNLGDLAGPKARYHRRGRQRHVLGRGINLSRDIPFPTVNGRTEYLDLYRPSSQPPAGGWPIIVAIHGGGWFKFGKNEYGSRIASAFVSRGFAVVAPNYLLSKPGSPTWPINLEDVQSAVRWTRSQAGLLGLNPDRIVAMGESAGGHLAELLGTGSVATPDTGVSDRVSAVVAFSGPSDLTSLFQQSPEAGARASRFLGGPPSALPAAYKAASPVDQVRPGDPPMFLVHGSADPLVPVAQSQEMSNALAAAGVPHRLVVLPGGTHNINFPFRYADLIPQILAFLGQS